MATIHRNPAPTADEPGRDFLQERMQIHQRCLGVLAHQLGNAASPIAMVADVLQLDSQLARRDAAVATLRRIALMLAQLTAVTRSLRGAPSPGHLVPRGVGSLTEWWTLYRPFAESMLPDSVRLEASLGPSAMSPGLADALTWLLPVGVAHVFTARPATAAITVSSRSVPETDTVRLEIEATGAAAVADTAAPGFRWLAFARVLVHQSGGELLDSETAVSSRVVLQLPASHA